MADAPKSKVCVVVVTGKVKPGQLPLFVENFRPLAAHVAAHEGGTLTYQLSTGYSDDPDRLCICERYVSKEYLETVHWQSEPFKQFGAKNREDGIEWVVKEVLKYEETDVGFMSR